MRRSNYFFFIKESLSTKIRENLIKFAFTHDYDKKFTEVTSSDATKTAPKQVSLSIFDYIETEENAVTSQNFETSLHDEINLYLSESHQDKYTQVLNYWQMHKSKYPIVSKYPSAPIERIFSHSGFFMRPHRSRISAINLQRLMLLKCNSELLSQISS